MAASRGILIQLKTALWILTVWEAFLPSFGCQLFSRLSPYSDWHIEVHQFRIEARGEHGAPPTPEGRHRDGVNFAMMVLIDRLKVLGGATVISDLDGNSLKEFVLTSPLEMAIVNDERVFHEVRTIRSLDETRTGHRDVLVVTFRQS
jgi:hypothetical protein